MGTVAFVDSLIQSFVLPVSPPDRTIVQAHQVHSNILRNTKYPRHMLANFADYMGKEQVLAKAIKEKTFSGQSEFTFRIFSDMTIDTVQRRRKFNNMFASFQAVGAQVSLIQMATLKVWFKGHFHLFSLVEDAQSFLAELKWMAEGLICGIVSFCACCTD